MAKKSNAREYKRSTVKRLHALSGNQCAAPDCVRKLIAREGETIISKICHIEAASLTIKKTRQNIRLVSCKNGRNSMNQQ